MTSLRQIEANRSNALKSTGPKTVAGKQRSRHTSYTSARASSRANFTAFISCSVAASTGPKKDLALPTHGLDPLPREIGGHDRR